MAIPNNYIDKITNKDTGDSRIISPAADKVRVENENFEGSDLDEVLDEVAQAIEDAGSGDGTVTGVKVGSTTYEPTEGVVDISPAIPDTSGLATKTEMTQGLGAKVDKVTGKQLSTEDYTSADKTKLAGIASGAQVNVINGIKANGASETLPVDQNGIVTLPPASAGGLTEEDISVSSNQDGTFDINVGEDTYTINLNHTHEGMAKLVKCTEATLPQTMADDTIYVQVDNLTTPQEIEALHIFGLEFTGGGLPAGTPQIKEPNANTVINLGTLSGQSGATGTVRIRGKNLTANSTVVVSVGSGFSLSYGQQSGSSVNIDAADAILGVDVVVTASSYGSEGTMTVVSSTDNINNSYDLTSDVVETLEGVKFTGSQWVKTDYYPGPSTEFELEMTAINQDLENGSAVLLTCALNTAANTDKIFRAYLMIDGYYLANDSSVNNNQSSGGKQKILIDGTTSAGLSKICASHNIFSYKINDAINTNAGGGMYLKNTPVGINLSNTTMIKATKMENPLRICYGATSNSGEANPTITSRIHLVVHRLTITEGGEKVCELMPVKHNGVACLQDTVSGKFFGSETSTELVAVTSNS